jgi:stringent starvation protein B
MAGEPIPQRPYLLRAMHEWMTDNGQTPHAVVDVTHAGVEVPAEHVSEGRIVLNLSYAAVRGLELGNEEVSFEARFGGRPRRVRFPVMAVLGIYARETGQGMIFSAEQGAESAAGASDEPVRPPASPKPGPGRKPDLKIIK